jgi:glycosyltransferase involved in cell wall biosynthesis
MNLAFVLHGKYFEGGGTGIYCDQVVRHLARQGHGVWLISSAPRDSADYLNDGVQFVHLPNPRSAVPFTSLLRWNLRVTRTLRAIESKHGLDVVEFASYHPEALAYLFSRRKAAVCIRVHEERTPITLGWLRRNPKDAVREALCWLQMARADVLMPFSEPIHENCIQFMKSARRAAKVFTIRSGIDMNVFSPAACPPAAYRNLEGKRIILFVGRITEDKGAYELIEAYRSQIAPQYRDTVLVLVGRAEKPDRLAWALQGTDGTVVHVDRVGQEELPAYYSHAYVFVGPSRFEPFGLVFVEALACGLPVIGVARGGPLEIVEPGKTGLLCPDNSALSIAQAIQQLLRDGGLRDRMAKSARASVVGRFGIDGVASDMAAMYDKIRETAGELK